MMRRGGQFIYNLWCRIGYELACKYLRSKEPGGDLSRMAGDKRGRSRKAALPPWPAPRAQPRRSSTPFDEVVKRALNRSKNASAACRGPGLLVILVASL